MTTRDWTVAFVIVVILVALGKLAQPSDPNQIATPIGLVENPFK